MRTCEETMMESTVAQFKNYDKWMKELPFFHFDKEWDVRILPPFTGAIIRFCIDYKGKRVSVYFDADASLGSMYDDNDEPIPYFEYYDGNDCHRYLLNESEKMMNDIRAFLNGGDVSDLENNFIAVDTAEEKDFCNFKKQIVRTYELSSGDEFIIILSEPCIMPKLKIGNYITEIEGLKIPDGDCKFMIEKIHYKKLKWWEFWKSWKPWRCKRIVKGYTVKVI